VFRPKKKLCKQPEQLIYIPFYSDFPLAFFDAVAHSSATATWCSTFHRGDKRLIMAKTVCKILGVVFLLVGIAGFAAPTLMGFHLGPAHNLVHIVSGAIALYFGFGGSLSGAKGFCLIFGIVYLALGIFGMTMGAGADRMLEIGPLHFGTPDHGLHIVIGAVFLAAGLFTKKA
jgi:hypothetical protein